MNRPRVVFDTNVVVSAAIRPGGPEARVVELAIVRELALYISKAVIAEYETVFARPKFSPRMVKILERVEKPGVLWKDPEEESHECAVADLRPRLVHQELLLSIMASPIGARIPKAYPAGFRLTRAGPMPAEIRKCLYRQPVLDASSAVGRII
jgi:predicted nucleic acid-binding protein